MATALITNAAELRKASYQVEALLLQGKPQTVIIDGLIAQAIDSGDNVPTHEFLEAAHEMTMQRWMHDACTSNLSYAKQLRYLQHLYDKSYKLNDFKTAASITKDINKLMQDIETYEACRL